MKHIILIMPVLLFSLISTSFSKIIYHTYPRICPRSDEFKVRINTKEVFVYHTSAGNFVSFESDSVATVEVDLSRKPENVNILPRRLAIEPEISDNMVTFNLPENEKILIEIDDMEAIYIYANAIQENKPEPGLSGLTYFKSGQVYEAGELVLKDNDTVYIEGGAVVRGRIRASSAKHIRIAGYGVLDGGYYSQYGQHSHFLRLEDCQNATLEDIIMIEPPGWMVVLYRSNEVQIRNIKQLGAGHGTDGIDIVSSQKVRINNCILRNGDDCIVVKSFTRNYFTEPVLNNIQGVNDILVQGCSVQANGGGQAFEIGHELTLNPVRNIRFIDCDVLGVHGQGGVFGIHNCDGATVTDVLYKDIRVDHYYNKLIDFRIIKSRWSREEKAGYIKNIVLENITVHNSIYNPGYSVSVIGGYDSSHKIENVTIENFFIDDSRVTNPDQLDLYIKQAENVIIR